MYNVKTRMGIYCISYTHGMQTGTGSYVHLIIYQSSFLRAESDALEG